MKTGHLLIKLLIFITVLTACNEKKYIQTNKEKKGIISSHTITPIIINIDSHTFSFEYYQRFDYYFNNHKAYFVGYNLKINAIDIINLLDNETPQHLYLDNQGPDGFSDVDALKVITPDSILIVDYSKFTIINREGKILWKMKREYPTTLKNIPTGFLSADVFFQPGYNQERKSIIVRYTPFKPEDHSDVIILAEIFLASNEVNLLPVYQHEYVSKFKHGCPLYLGPQVALIDNKMILNFPFASNIYEYQFDKGVINEHGGKSKYTPNLLAIFQKEDDPDDFFLSSISFHKPVTDSYHKLIYRIHHGGIQPASDGIKRTYYDKPMYLTVFDDEYNYLYETKLDIETGIVPDQLIPTPQGLIVFPQKQTLDALESNRILAFKIHFE